MRRSIGGLCAALVSLVVLPATASAADVPPQEPGVTLRVYDLQTELSKLCTLKAGQTPNVDKLMPAIDWSGTEFGVADFFQSEVIANLNVGTAGTHAFRITSDDGSRLRIDGSTVINHDGLHSPTPAEGSVDLTTGYHALRIDHFDNAGGQQITLEWRPPGASAFTVVPNSVLSTDADVVRVTAPGRKECEASGDSPGDGLPLTGVHPNYTLTNLRPAGFEPQVSAMDWLPDGRLAIATWGRSDNELGEVYLLSGVTGSTDPSRVTTQRIASGLKEPMGIKYVDGKLYVSEKDGLTELNDTNGDWVTDNFRTVATWPFGGNFHEFAFGLLYRDGFFYLNLSVAINLGGATTDPQPAPNRGTTIKVNKATGAVSYVAGGLRTPHGIGWGPDGDVFVTDNQGGWLPSSKLLHIKQDRFFNHYMNPDGPFDNRPVTQPVLWLPQNEIANSPVNPVQLTTGPFAGQMVFGDVTYGGLQRGYLEKVNGEYQGAVFRMTQGLEAGVSRISLGPDGAIYTGGIGAGGNWGQPGKLSHGLQKLTPSGTSAFDILAMRAVEGGFELEYTQPLSTTTVQDLAAKYQVQQWRYVPTADYGGPKVDQRTLTVTSATPSADRRKVTLKMSGLQAGHVVHVRSPRPFAAESGASLWSTEAWYTLNALVGTAGRATDYEAETAGLSGGASVNTDHAGYSGTGFVDGYWNAGATTSFTVSASAAGTHTLALRYSNGPNPFAGTKTVSLYVNGTKVKQVSLTSTGNWDTWATHTETVPLNAGNNTVVYRYDTGDSGNVNLDKLTVAPGQRIVLFDGTNLNAWEARSGGAATWPISGGSMESLGGDIRTRQKFGDFRLHVEWYEPQYPPEVTGQARGNSGVFLQERYEVQVLESFGKPPAINEAGSIYNKRAPNTNAATASGTWQTYDITFRAARFDSAGNKIANARVTVVWNGVTVHNDVEVNGGTGDSLPEDATPQSIRLQDHGDPGANPRFRNIWIEPLP
ncbi:family 16 glycoside hydrolase [Actinophytocola sp. NPDC049390]|uniref:family 16 glycoside hydrolase n=1 Tax=Actinophytocola sp. NPDC049390 TaxID=3363894 RepID=UPI00378A54F5